MTNLFPWMCLDCFTSPLRGKHFPSYDAVVLAVKQWATTAGAGF
jgi:hypothetical protein